MILGRVKGTVVSTIKHPVWESRRALMVDRISPGGEELGSYLVAFDTVGATVGQTVLILDEGNSARQVVGDSTAPMRSVIIGIVDEITVE
ncbi:MAG: EutN/CcmL family microcompartment protein [Phycisphaerae bacterium]|nr:EutN/CcmL family microcompartment protein [Phycisphaerae bacterium]